MKTQHRTIIRPIGLNKPCSTIENVCADARKYRIAELMPGPFIIGIDEGDGRGTLSIFFEEMFTNYEVIPFTGIDHSITLKFIDSLKPFDIHYEAAIYDSFYSGLEFHELTDKFAETCYDCNLANAYVTKTVEASEHAVLVIYVPRNPGKSLERLLGTLQKELDFTVIKTNCYSVKELGRIVERIVIDSGTSIEAPDFNEVVSKLISFRGIESAAEASDLAKELIFSADYEGYNPVISNRVLSVFKTEGNAASGRGGGNARPIMSNITNIKERI